MPKWQTYKPFTGQHKIQTQINQNLKKSGLALSSTATSIQFGECSPLPGILT